MRPHLLPPFLAGLIVFTPVARLSAAVFNRAEVTRVHNRVTLIDPDIGRRPAVVRDVIEGDGAVQTGLESRAELLFPDSTLTRLASNTMFSFRAGTRQIELKSGAILFQVPPGSGGTEIHAAAITAAITGTTGFVERVGNVYKLIVLEGDVRAYIRNRVGESIIVRGGHMLIAPLNSTSVRQWQSVPVDVQKLTRSSKLLDRKLFKPLPKQARDDIAKVIDEQQRGIARGRLNRTNLVINGGVTDVIVVDNQTRTNTDADPRGPGSGDTDPPPPITVPSVTPAPDDNDPDDPGPRPTPNPDPTPDPSPDPDPTATPRVIANSNPYVISRDTRIVTAPTGEPPRITTGERTDYGRVYRGAAVSGSASRYLFGSTSNFDRQSNFDARFGQNFEPGFAPNGVAVFKFRSLRLTGPPTINATGRRDLALIATGSGATLPAIRSGAPGGAWDLSNLRSLFLGTKNSTISLDETSGFFATGDVFQYLQLYARGDDSDVLFDGLIRLTRNLYIDAQRDIVFGGDAEVLGRSLYLNAGRDARLGGEVEGMFVQVAAGGAVTFDGLARAETMYVFGDTAQVNGGLDVDRLEFQLTGEFANGVAGSMISAREFYVTADSFSLNSDEENGTVFNTADVERFDITVTNLEVLSNFTLPDGAIGNLTVGENIDAENRNLIGFNAITTLGSGDDRLRDVATRTFSAGNNLLIGRDLTADFVSAGGVLDVRRELLPYSSDPALLRFVTADRIAIDRGINFAGANGSANPAIAPGDGLSLELHASEIIFSDPTGMPNPDVFAIGGANLNGGDASPPTGFEGGSGGTLNIGSEAVPIAGDVTLDGPITATTGRNANEAGFGGRGGSVNVVANGTISTSSSIEVSSKTQRRNSKTGGNVRMTSNKLTGTAIRVANTAQIASLLAAGAPGPGGEIVFRSAGGDIDISGTVTADRGRVEIQNTGNAGRIALNSPTISADVVRARAYGENGILVVNGGTITADSMLKLYADGSNGTVLFSGNVSLNGNSTKIITGNTVTIAPNVVVTIGGPNPAQVYTNNPNYTGSGGNGTSTGHFAGAGATTQPKSEAPGY